MDHGNLVFCQTVKDYHVYNGIVHSYPIKYSPTYSWTKMSVTTYICFFALCCVPFCRTHLSLRMMFSKKVYYVKHGLKNLVSRIVLTLIIAALNFQIICESVVVPDICRLNKVFWTENRKICSSPVLYDAFITIYLFHISENITKWYAGILL